jgi:DNA-binding transcriptional LysR family regulator
MISRLAELARAFNGLELHVVRGTADDVATHLKKGDADLAVSGPLAESWDRLESWPLFTERFHVAVSKRHRFASGDAITAQDLNGENLITRTQCEVTAEFAEFLKARQTSPKVWHVTMSEDDHLLVLEAGFGVGLMPESAARPESFARIPMRELDLNRTVFLHAVSGRHRSPVVDALTKLLRSADWKAQIAMQLEA